MENVKTLPEGNYIGYYWMSDASEPVIVEGRLPDHLKMPNAASNPFILEAKLFNTATSESCSIKFVDGAYFISVVPVKESLRDVKAGKYDNITLKRYFGHRMNDRELLFFQYWDEQRDPLCEGMDVLQPSTQVFVGFKNKIS